MSKFILRTAALVTAGIFTISTAQAADYTM